MTTFQKIIKYLAIALAIFLIVSIFSGILGAVGLFGGLSDKEAVGQLQTYPVTQNIHTLKVEINAADLTIRTGEAFGVESNLKDLKVEEKDGVLTIRETKRFNGGTYLGALLTISVPADRVFEKVSITTGAAKLTAERLSAGAVELELGAGEVTVAELVATSHADIDGGAGKITIANGTLHNLDMDMGVGQLTLTAALTGDCEFDLGVGESDITLIGSKEDYKLEIEKGLGSITVDGKLVSDYGSSGNGKNKVEINGGVGAIRVNFREPM